MISYYILNNKRFIQRCKRNSKGKYELHFDSFGDIQASSKRRNFFLWIEIIFKHMKQDLIEDNWITRNFKLLY